MTRNMEKTVMENANTIPAGYGLTLSEMERLFKKARLADANETITAISQAFTYGFVLGNRASKRQRVKT